MVQEGEVEEVAQLLVTVPEDTLPGTVLQIPLNGGRTVRARVPQGYAPGMTLVLTKREGMDVWEVDPDAIPPQGYNQDDYGRPQDTLSPSLEDPVCHTVRLETTVGHIDIIVRLDWAPYGARRFLELASCGDLDDLAFYRSIKGCLAQFGLPTKHQWPPIPDDPPFDVPFLLGAVCFAANSPNSRKSTLFICTGDMSQWFGEEPWETPIGAVAEVSLDVLDRIETAYGETAECGGPGPQVTRLIEERNGYLRREFPRLTYINRALALDWPQQANVAASPLSPPPVSSNALPCAVEVVGMHEASHAAVLPSWPGSFVPNVSSPPPQEHAPAQEALDTELAKMEAQKAAVEAALQRARSLGSAQCAQGGSSPSDTPTVIQHKPVVAPSGGGNAQQDPQQQALQAPMLLPPLQLSQMQLPQFQPLQFQANSNQAASQPSQGSQGEGVQHTQPQGGNSQQGSPTQVLVQPSAPPSSQMQSAQPQAGQQCPSPAADELSATRASNPNTAQSVTRSLSYVPPPPTAQSGQSYSYVAQPQGTDVAFGLKPAQWISPSNGVAFGLQPVNTDAYGGGSPQPAWTSPCAALMPTPPTSMSLPCAAHHGAPPPQEAFRPLGHPAMQPGMLGMMGGGMPMPPPPISTPLAPPGSWTAALPGGMLGGPFYPFAGPMLPAGPGMGARLPMLGPMPFPSLGMP
mmetsp:Transcript_34500/g.78756  ORF Transcript_34500/g.78756 Transcript_34500/m.78756 type:complete len:688 (+) Transcript_34500:158-2221(+)